MPGFFKHRNKVIQIFVTLALAGLLYGVALDLRQRYAPIFAIGGGFPQSLLVALVLSFSFLVLMLLQTWLPSVFNPFNRLRSSLGSGRWLLAPFPAAAICWLFLYTKWSDVFSGTWVRLLFYLAALWTMAWLAARPPDRVMTWQGLVSALVLLESMFVFTQAFQGAVSYPFGTSWSEGNRLWDYSVLYGHRLYDYPAGKPILAYIDIGRQSLWGLPFLIPSVTITAVRAWSAFLFTFPYIFLGWFIFNRQHGRMGFWLLAGLWSMIFLNQGPIYTPLVLAAILVAGSRRMPWWLSAAFVFLASYYAWMTRTTWLFAPGIWAATVAFIEKDPFGVHKRCQRWGRAIALGFAGILGGYGIQLIRQLIAKLTTPTAVTGSGVLREYVTSSLSRQPLIWSRLLPNPTYPEGILLGLLLAIGPVIMLLVLSSLRTRWHLDIWQKMVLWIGLLAFLVVGLIVSVKIGGGSNLHNLDMFLIGLLFTLGLASEEGLFEWLHGHTRPPALFLTLLILATLIPASREMMSAAPRNLPSVEKVNEALEAIREAISNSQPGGEVLFIDQRQLLTFGQVPRVPLVVEYEKKYLLDQAMADNAAYFAPFFKDMATHRFAVIISEPLWIKYQGEGYQFGSENDAWVKWVSVPVLCHYQPVETFLDVGIQILIPRESMLNEPGIPCPSP